MLWYSPAFQQELLRPSLGRGSDLKRDDQWDPLTMLEWTAHLSRRSKTRQSATWQKLKRKNSRSSISGMPRAKESSTFIPLLDRDHSLCLFKRSHPLRRRALAIISSKSFDGFILIAIVLSSICLALPYLTYPGIERLCLESESTYTGGERSSACASAAELASTRACGPRQCQDTTRPASRELCFAHT